MIEIGQVVGNYKVTQKLGEGGMGVVFLAEHPVIGRRAALKAIHPEFSGNGDVVTRFVNEARSISQIGHDHIVEVTDFGRTEGGDFYIIMEYLQGEALSDRIALEAPFAPERALGIAAQIADALAASHGCGVVHRDLKPENVILVERGGVRDFVKVLDFGLAKLAGNGGEASPTQSGMLMGTPYYMAPEQCHARGQIDERTDVYALGIILFEMLTGHVPFGGESAREVIRKQVSMRPPAVRSYRTDLPEVIDVLIHRALAKKPAERFPSMVAFREALLFPMKHAGSTPVSPIIDDQSGRLRGPQSMTRTELLMRPGAHRGRSTLREGAGELVRQSDTVVNLVPARNRRGAWLAFAAAAVAGGALAIGMAHNKPASAIASTLEVAEPAVPRKLVRVTFGSDPHGADIIGADGRSLGVTPLSIEIPSDDAPVEYTFRSEGFIDKKMALIPNLPTPLFAILQPEPKIEPAVPHVPSQAEPRVHARRPHRVPRPVVPPTLPLTQPPPVPVDVGGDGILTPTFE